MNESTITDIKQLFESAMEMEPPIAYYKFLLSITLLIICVISTSTNILILLTMSIYKDKRSAMNVYLRNFVICDVIYITINTMEYLIRAYFLDAMSFDIKCATSSFANVIRSVDVLFMLMLVYQWFFAQTRLKSFEKHPQFFCSSLWIILFIQLMIMLSTCSMGLSLDYGENSLGFAMMLFDVFLCCFMILRKCANPFSKTIGTLPIAITNALPLFWLIPLITGLIALNLHIQSDLVRAVIQMVDLLVFLYPLMTFWMFYRMDEKFKNGLRIVFGKEVSEEDRLDFFDDPKDLKMGSV